MGAGVNWLPEKPVFPYTETLNANTDDPEQSGFPLNTEMWAGEMNVKDREHSQHTSDGWPHEQAAYDLDRALRLTVFAKGND